MGLSMINFTRILLCLMAFFATATSSVGEPAFAKVPFVSGPKSFRGEDYIVITAVEATSPGLKVGDWVKVKGHYQLTSCAEARLSLFLTQTEPGSSEKVSPRQTNKVSAGTGVFDLQCEVRKPGFLHVSFYPAANGESFGGVYFGTPDQMKRIKDFTSISSSMGNSRNDKP